METTIPIDLFVVTYDTDLHFLEMQARSIDKFFKITDINKIIIVHNNLDGTRTPIDLSLYGKFEHKVTEILFNNLKLIDNYTNRSRYGWARAQFCKLFLTSWSTATWSLVLDSKLIFLKQYNYEEYFTSDNKAIRCMREHSPIFNKSNNWLEKFFDMEPSAPETLLPERATPILMHTQTLRDVIAEIGQRSYISFWDWFMLHQFIYEITEFDLYFNYICYSNRLSEIYHIVDDTLTPRHLVLLKNHQIPAQDFNNFISSFEIDYFHTVQLSQEYIDNLTQEHKDYWNNFLKYKTIVKT